MTDMSAELVEQIIAKLPRKDTVSIPDVCVAAYDLHRDVVQGWIDSGEVDAIDLAGGTKSNWRISRRSLELFLRRRTVGLRAPAERRLENRQLSLFETDNP
jgi:hypothetical protein